MAIDTLHQKKQEVAEKYLKDLKAELWFLKWNIVGILGKKIKEMMISDVSLWESLDTRKFNLREQMLISISPKTAERVFKFIKEKQEKIQMAKTEVELEALKTGIVVTPSASTTTTQLWNPSPEISQPQQGEPSGSGTETDKEKQEKGQEKGQYKGNKNIETAVGVGWWLGLSVLATERIYKLQQAKKIESTIDLKTPEQFANKMKDQFMSLSKQLEEEAKLNPKLTKFQSKALAKSAKEFENVSKEMNGKTLDAVAMLGKLDKKLPASILKSIDPKQEKILMKITDADFDLIKSGKEIEAFKWLDMNIINVLKSADNIDEFKGMVYTLQEAKGVRGFLKGVKGIAFLDLISTGFDVRVLMEGLDEAEAYKKLNTQRSSTKREHQWVQFWVSVALTALNIIGTCAAASSVVPGLGTVVWAVIGVLGYAASQAVDIYYDKVEFYLQNEEDFKRQYRTEIKQAIVQSAGAEQWNLNMGARLEASTSKAWANRAERNLIPFGMVLAEKVKLTTTEDARKALLRQEEYRKSEYTLIQQGYASWALEEEYKKTLSATDLAEFEKQKSALNTVIGKRLEYVRLHMYENKGTKEYQSFISALKSGMGIKRIEQVLADSKMYMEMKNAWSDQYVPGCGSINEYKQKYGEKLRSEDGQKFALFEEMWKASPYRFLEIYAGVESFESVFENAKKEEPDQQKITTIQNNMDFIKRFYAYKTMGLPLEEQKRLELSMRVIDNRNMEAMLTTGKFDAVNTYSEDNVKRYFTNSGILERLDIKVEVSDKVGQNIIYRIAREIHGYTWDNDMKQLMRFFSMGKENATGLYYDNKWIVNNDRAIDKGVDISAFETMTAEQILKERVRPNNRNYVFNAMDPVALLTPGLTGVSIFWFTDKASIIDTPTEGMDDKLNEEYRKRVSRIIYEEKAYSMPEAKKLVEQKIVDYIKANAKGWYIELPYRLIIAGKKAKIGNLQKYLFAYQGDKVVACTTKLYLDEKLDFSQTKTSITKEYISWTQEQIGENAQRYIDYVDQAKKRFEDLITYDVDELDIPKEYLESYQQKIKEWEMLKQSMLTLDPDTAASQLSSKYETYHDYFEQTYMAMLKMISTFKTSNDLDSAQYHQQVENIADQLSTIRINKGTIVLPADLLSTQQKKEYDELLPHQTIEGKGIVDLVKSANKVDQAKAIRWIKQIIKSILESQVLVIDDRGEIKEIGVGENPLGMWMQLQKRLDVNINRSTYFDVSRYTIETKPSDVSNVQIKEVTQPQEQVLTKTNEVEKIIQSTEPDLIYPGRWLVTFDPEKNLLTSRSKSIEIDSSNLKIKGLDIIFATLKELVMAANLMNRFKAKYPWVKDFYFGSRVWLGVDYGIYRLQNGLDTQILDLDRIKQRFPSFLTTDNDVKDAVIKYINAIT